MKSRPWHTERLPELLWAVLIVGAFDREDALNVFRRVADHIFKLPPEEQFSDITHSGLASLSEPLLDSFLSHLLESDSVNEALAPLLLLPALPGFESWSRRLRSKPSESSWRYLMSAVAKTLHHQSQPATDCRWLRILTMMVAGKLAVPPETAKEIGLYPNHGDMRKVRPSIRATEIAFARDPSDWPEEFWSHCFRNTPCWALRFEPPAGPAVVAYTRESLRSAWSAVVNHCSATTATTEPDPRHDAVFGIALYSLAIAGETITIGNSESALGRCALRTVVECCITLAYLLKNDSPELWSTFRVYGAGQVKLAFLKLGEARTEPNFVDLEALNRLANEDAWQEFLPINLGHWEGSNLRIMSEAAGMKGLYDRYYDWTSSFSHGNWGAVREHVFDTCGNPLHRLHRIPRDTARLQPDVLPDLAAVVDQTLDLVAAAYPGLAARLSVTRIASGVV